MNGPRLSHALDVVLLLVAVVFGVAAAIIGNWLTVLAAVALVAARLEIMELRR